MSAAVIQGATRGIGFALVEALLARVGVERVFATGRRARACAALQALSERHAGRVVPVDLDVTDEAGIADAASRIAEATPHIDLLVNCAGLLHDNGMQPEKRLEQLDAGALQRAFAVNAIGPALVVKHLFPLLPRRERSVVVDVSARVGSIEDDRRGGWYGYRASKAAQNMLTKNLALELARRAPGCICIAYHPGTVETDLSAPFRRGVPEGQLKTPAEAAACLLALVDGLDAQASGQFFAWDGTRIPW